MKSTVPGLIDAFVGQAKFALPNVRVSDGLGVTEDPGDFLMVGVDDPEGPVNTATGQQEPGPFGTGRPRDETGQINFLAYSWNGDTDQKAARDAVFAMADVVGTLCRTTPSLGVTGVLWTGPGSSFELSEDQDPNGALAALSFSISFRSRI